MARENGRRRAVLTTPLRFEQDTYLPMKMIFQTIVLALVAGAIIAGGVVGWRLSGLPYLDTPDKFFYDLRYHFFAKREPSARPEFAILSISERSLNGYPAVKPVDRGLLARLVTELRESGVRAIGLNFQFDWPTTPEKDEALAQAIAAAGPRLAVGVIDTRSGDADLAFQQQLLASAPQAQRGHLYFDGQKAGLGQQPDLAARFIAPRTGNPDEVATSFAEALLAAADVPVQDIGQTRIVEAGQPGPHIAWVHPVAANSARAFTLLEVRPQAGRDAAAEDETLLTPVQRQILRDRIVILGADVERNDNHLTPFSVWNGARMTGAEVHAQIAAQLKDGRQVATLTLPLELGLAVAIAVLAFLTGYVRGFRGHRPHAIWGNTDYVIVGAGLAIVASAAFAIQKLILPTDTMLYAALLGVLLGHVWYDRALRRAESGGQVQRRSEAIFDTQ